MAYRRTNLAAATAAVTNRFVTSTNMKVGAYTVANASASWAAGFLVTVGHTTVATGTDTLGTITVTGTDLNGAALSETITPVADSTATGTRVFRTVTGVSGAGWVIAGGNDTIIVGHAAGAYVASSTTELGAVVVNTTAAGTVALADADGAIATLKASIAEGVYRFEAQARGYLKVSLAAASDVTVLHAGTIDATSYTQA